MTKLAGGLFGALLVFLVGKWVSEEIYAMHKSHGDDHHAQAYVIDTSDGDGAEEEVEEVSFASLMAAADIDKGEKVFGKCKACHKLEAGANSTGPYLYGVVGRTVDTAEGFGYSGALEEVVEVWTPEELFNFLENPKGYAPGTTMAFNGLKKPTDRANLIAFLDMTDGDMTEIAMPEEEAAMEEPAAEEAVEEAAAEEPAAEEAVEEAAAEEPAVEEAATEEAAAEETVAEEAAAAETETEAATGEATEAAETEMAAVEETATEEATTEEAVVEEAAAEASGFAALVAAADIAAGEKVFKKCKACHTLESGKNRVGPYLTNIVDRDVAASEGFKYSNAMADFGGTWTYENLDAFLTKPKDFMPGTKMAFNGLKNEEERAAVIAYIQSGG
ncbi:c-type cytochrome [Roseovarius sp. 2305UL8-3]|uniref:c-type cytochrome n=1 Tax=Roseovarius conchicola TaxID=3121636 RepID=UPI003528AB1D